MNTKVTVCAAQPVSQPASEHRIRSSGPGSLAEQSQGEDFAFSALQLRRLIPAFDSVWHFYAGGGGPLVIKLIASSINNRYIDR